MPPPTSITLPGKSHTFVDLTGILILHMLSCELILFMVFIYTLRPEKVQEMVVQGGEERRGDD